MKFCPECGAPTQASTDAAAGMGQYDMSSVSGMQPGDFDRRSTGDILSQDIGQSGQYEQGMYTQDQMNRAPVTQGQPAMGQYQQPQYQQGQFQQGQYLQGQFQQGQYPPQGQMPPYQGSYNQAPPAKPKQSGMSTAAMILGILTCTAIIGFIVGLIDLIKNKDDGNKHGGSIFAVIWGGIILLATISNAVRLGHERTTEDTRTAVESTQSDTTDYSADSYDTAPAEEDSSQEQQSNDPGVVDPNFKAALDSYEEFLDEYINFMKNYLNSSDPMAMLSEYTTYMTKYAELADKMSELDKMQDQMSQADLAYYIDWNARIQKKILEISNFN